MRYKLGTATYSISELAESATVNRSTLESRLRRGGWSVRDAMTQPSLSRSECGRRGRQRSFWGKER